MLRVHAVKVPDPRPCTRGRRPDVEIYRGFETRASLLSSGPGAWLKIRPIGELAPAAIARALAAECARLAAGEEAADSYILGARVCRGLDSARQTAILEGLNND